MLTLVHRAKRLDPNAGWSEITLLLTDDPGMVACNRAVFGRDGATDVISQRYAALPGETRGADGELVINVQRACAEGARRAGGRRAWDEACELALYIAHGCDHLAGEDDADAPSRRRMRRRELRWVHDAVRAGCVAGILERT